MTILKDINIKIFDGEFLAIMGPSGSGKSTLMNIIGCLDRASSGLYLLNKQEISTYNDEDLAKVRNIHIGFVFQQFQLLPRLTAIENVELPMIYAGVSRKERRARAEDALRKVGLSERMKHLPNELSGGQKQRVAIARSIVNNPTLILADEPTGALDTKTSADIMEQFVRLNEAGTTIVVITHEPEVAEYASRTIVVRDGKILAPNSNIKERKERKER
ncbi:ABC transporter ATP-binding protein [Priestia megaterium]|uniref:ABC transporter ATP-binding protein n=1 Tax=Priestia megaterium TaxID=1404 RepID=UPI002FFEFA34